MSFNGDLYTQATEVITTQGDLRRGDSSGNPERLGIGILLWLLRPLFGIAKNITET